MAEPKRIQKIFSSRERGVVGEKSAAYAYLFGTAAWPDMGWLTFSAERPDKNSAEPKIG